jgi:hypothetical protein
VIILAVGTVFNLACMWAQAQLAFNSKTAKPYAFHAFLTVFHGHFAAFAIERMLGS